MYIKTTMWKTFVRMWKTIELTGVNAVIYWVYRSYVLIVVGYGVG